jgi:CheY-like chemotaxis protein
MTAEQPARNEVLLVEDDSLTRDMLQGLLEREGFVVAAVANGREALNYLYRNHRPCLILLDLMMPVMNGWEFRTLQKRDPDLARIPVIVCSAAGDLHQEVSLMGAQGCLQKPVDPDSLLAAVRRFCR